MGAQESSFVEPALFFPAGLYDPTTILDIQNLRIFEHNNNMHNTAENRESLSTNTYAMWGSVSSGSTDAELRNRAHLEAIPEHHLASISDIVGLVLLGSSRPSASFSSTFARGVSPLLATSDVGLGRVIDVIYSSRGHFDPVQSFQGDRNRCRPRIVSMKSLKEQPLKIGHFSPQNQNCPETSHINTDYIEEGEIDSCLDEFRCPICLDIFDRPVYTPCRHVFCVDCIIASLLQQSLCPLCRSALYVHDIKNLSDPIRDKALKLLYMHYLNISVECPKCNWIGTMGQWDSHIKSSDCERTRTRGTPEKNRSPRTFRSCKAFDRPTSDGLLNVSNCSITSLTESTITHPSHRMSHPSSSRRSFICETNTHSISSSSSSSSRTITRPTPENLTLNRRITRRARRRIAIDNETDNLEHRSTFSVNDTHQLPSRTSHDTNGVQFENTEGSSAFNASASETLQQPFIDMRATIQSDTIRESRDQMANQNFGNNNEPIPFNMSETRTSASIGGAMTPEITINNNNNITVFENSNTTTFTTSRLTSAAQMEISEIDNCPFDNLSCWLLDHKPGNLSKLYVVTHRMENVMGALAGTMLTAAHHAQAILEFTPPSSLQKTDDFLDSYIAVMNNPKVFSLSSNSINNTQVIQYKTFVSMELFGDQEAGLEWEIFREVFPPLKSTSQQIAVYDCQSVGHLDNHTTSGIDISLVVEFLMCCRHKKYSLIGWNCQTFITDFKRFIGISNEPTVVREIPRPGSYSDSLMTFLSKISQTGDLPILNSIQLNPDWITGRTRQQRRKLRPTILETNSENFNGIYNNNIGNNSSSSSSSSLNTNRAPQQRSGVEHGCHGKPSSNWSNAFQLLLPRALRKQNDTITEINRFDPSTRTLRQNQVTPSIPLPRSTSHNKHHVSNTPPAPPRPAQVRIRSVILCLFPAEDLHRASLWPAATVAEFWTRALRLSRPSPTLKTALPVASGGTRSVASRNNNHINNNNQKQQGINITPIVDKSDLFNTRPPKREFGTIHPDSQNSCYTDLSEFEGNDAESSTTLPASQIRLRYRTLPILIFHLETLISNPAHNSSSSVQWESLCYISLEFRSDCGLWWHVYHEYPPGLKQSVDTGGTDFVFSSQTLFPLEALQSALNLLRDKTYHPTQWSGWEFSESILQQCCPSIAKHLLLPPVADLLDGNIN